MPVCEVDWGGGVEGRIIARLARMTGDAAGRRDAKEAVVLERGIATIEGVGPSKVKEFEARGVRTLGDLLEYFPRSYQQERSERPIDQLVADQIQIARGSCGGGLHSHAAAAAL